MFRKLCSCACMHIDAFMYPTVWTRGVCAYACACVYVCVPVCVSPLLPTANDLIWYIDKIIDSSKVNNNNSNTDGQYI